MLDVIGDTSRLGEKVEARVLASRFWGLLIIQQTEARGKTNPDGLDLSLRATRSCLSKPGVEQMACTSKGEAVGKEPTDFHWISIGKPHTFSHEKGFPVRKPLLFRFWKW